MTTNWVLIHGPKVSGSLVMALGATGNTAPVIEDDQLSLDALNLHLLYWWLDG